MKHLLIAVVLVLSPGLLIAADFNTGMTAYERQDYGTAAREFSALAEAGDHHSQYMLGRLYARGSGVPQNYVQAHKWYNLAASQGHSHAARARDALARHMHSNQVSQAQRLAAQWRQKADMTEAKPPPADSDVRPWRRVLVHDTFRDGDYTRDPYWTVAAGLFRVESGIGLRSVYEPREAPVAAETSAEEDLPMAILGAIFGTRQEEAPAEPPDYAEIYLNQSITNAFNIQILLTLRQPAPGPLVFGPYQGSKRVNGYHLAYTPDVSRGLHLVRVTDAGSSVLASVDPRLEPDRQYNIQWTRDESRGGMSVSIDGREVLRISDTRLMEPFDGFTLINRGGDYVLREITIRGVD